MRRAIHLLRRQSVLRSLTTLTLAAVISTAAVGQAMTMSPHKLVLNAVGNSEDVQAIISFYIPGGYSISDFEVSLTFGSQEVATAASLRYCYVDQNLIAGFDKEQLLSNPAVIAMAGETVCATVEGWFVAVNSDGDSYTRSFSGTDLVEIAAPGKSSSAK